MSYEIINAAACDAAVDLAFVAGEVFVPILVEQLQVNLNTESLRGIGPTEAAIFRTPAGTPFVDVFAGSDKQTMPERNAKDYDTLKWEQELRSQLARKQGLHKKLTTDEQAKVKAQLAKEAKVREDVSILVKSLRRRTGIIKSLARSRQLDA